MRGYLRKLRKDAGLTQADVAKKLAEILGVSLEMILENESTGF